MLREPAEGLSPAVIEAQLTPEALSGVRAAPGFRATVERYAADAIAADTGLDPVTRWLVKDLGRLSLYLAAHIIEAMLGRVCAHDLLVAAEMNKTCSRGRVLAFVERLEQVGWARVAEGPDSWTRRPLIFADPFYSYGRRRFQSTLKVVAPLLPEAARALSWLDDPRAFAAGLVVSGLVTLLRRDLVYDTGASVPFMHQNGGMRVINEWLTRQSPQRDRLLDSVELNRSSLARRADISRAHLNLLLADAEAAGWLSLPRPDRIVFAPAMSEVLERHFSLVFQVHRLNAMAILETCAAAAPAARRA